MKPIYSLQLMQGIGILGELLINGANTGWFLYFVLSFVLLTLFNFIAEMKRLKK